jgi:hypothetical protein
MEYFVWYLLKSLYIGGFFYLCVLRKQIKMGNEEKEKEK